MITKHINTVYTLFFSKNRKKQVEHIIFMVAIGTFLLHLSLTFLIDLNLIYKDKDTNIILNPLITIYTPFSIILLFEIYSLIYYLPQSITHYLGKQYEIIALILIRKMFYDLSNLPIKENTYDMEQVMFLFMTFASFILFCLLIFCFYKLSGKKDLLHIDRVQPTDKNRRNYITIKKVFALTLLFLLIFLCGKSILIIYETPLTSHGVIYLVKKINESFFNTFFTVLILVEVLLLLLTFNLTDRFHKIIRNSGFIISTILLKLSFQTEGTTNLILIFGAIAFGVCILGVYRLFERKL